MKFIWNSKAWQSFNFPSELPADLEDSCLFWTGSCLWCIEAFLGHPCSGNLGPCARWQCESRQQVHLGFDPNDLGIARASLQCNLKENWAHNCMSFWEWHVDSQQPTNLEVSSRYVLTCNRDNCPATSQTILTVSLFGSLSMWPTYVAPIVPCLPKTMCHWQRTCRETYINHSLTLWSKKIYWACPNMSKRKSLHFTKTPTTCSTQSGNLPSSKLAWHSPGCSNRWV